MATYLVTGAAGFIGSHLVEALLERGERVRLLDNFSTGKRENLGFLEQRSWPAGAWELLEGDVRDPELCRRAVRGVDYVLHQAALASVIRSVDNPIETHETNVTGTLNVLLAARDARIKRFVYASSSSAYGAATVLPQVETLPAMPLSPYAVSKYAGELYCRAFFQVYGLETVALRYFNIYGPRQDPASRYAAVVPRFLAALLQREPPVIYGDGQQTRDFTFVADCVRANLLASNAEGVAGEVFNVACGRQTSVLDLWRQVASLDGSAQKLRFESPRPGEARHTLADLTRAQARLGYTPQYDLRQGLERTWHWWRAHYRASTSP